MLLKGIVIKRMKQERLKRDAILAVELMSFKRKGIE